MSIEKRAHPNVDLVTPELEMLLSQFSDEEVASGVVASGAALPDERHSAEALVEQLNEVRLQPPEE